MLCRCVPIVFVLVVVGTAVSICVLYVLSHIVAFATYALIRRHVIIAARDRVRSRRINMRIMSHQSRRTHSTVVATTTTTTTTVVHALVFVVATVALRMELALCVACVST